MSNVQNLEVFAGENYTPTIYARDVNNAPVSLAGKTIQFYIGFPPCAPGLAVPVITYTGTIISAPAGSFSVAVQPVDTKFREGDYGYIAQTTDSQNNLSVVSQGRFRIKPSLIPYGS